MAAVLALALLAWAFAYSEVTVAWRAPRFARRARRSLDLAAFLAEVSARLRAGGGEAESWARAAERNGLNPEVTDGAPAALASIGPEAAVRGARASALLARELGAPLADLLDHYGRILIQTQAASDALHVALAGPRASARLLAALPALGLLIGSAMGARPLEAVVGAGTVPFAVGLMLLVLGQLWTRAMIVRAARLAALEEAIDAHLLAGALETGAAIPRALSAVGRVAERPTLEEAGGLLALGATWEEAWGGGSGPGRDAQSAPRSLSRLVLRIPDSARISVGKRGYAAQVRGGGGLVERVLEPAWTDGANPVPLLVGAAASVLARSDRAAREAAERLAVRLVLPLGLCFLPAFILIGVVPIVISLGIGLV
ncbi:tight adherence protein B [Ruaniaceae bacterium KH17]|nr:tight adherence protein B [Ruaniaceae bacterium KH17]